MFVAGFDDSGKAVALPNNLDEYYIGAAKRFAHIRVMQIHMEDSFVLSPGVLGGDFSLLRAFLADHEGALFVSLKADKKVDLFFPSYVYGFVEDTFARAIHHKIEGAGYACRECVGKKEIRLREYDRLFGRVCDDDVQSGIFMAMSRLLSPVELLEEDSGKCKDFLKKHCKEALNQAQKYHESVEIVSCLAKENLLSEQSVRDALEEFSNEKQAEIVAILISYLRSKRSGRRRISL